MEQRYSLAHILLIGVVVLGLTPLMMVVDAQAQIVFASDRHGDGAGEIYVMDADGGNPLNLTNHPDDDYGPAWFRHSSGVAPAGKALMMWDWVKQVDR